MNGYETAWLAGLLEGEGSFCVDSRGDGRRAHLIVSLQMADKDVVQRAADLVGGRVLESRRVKLRPNESKSWRLKLGGAKAETVIRRIRPHMGRRRGAKMDALLRLDLSHRPRKASA